MEILSQQRVAQQVDCFPNSGARGKSRKGDQFLEQTQAMIVQQTASRPQRSNRFQSRSSILPSPRNSIHSRASLKEANLALERAKGRIGRLSRPLFKPRSWAPCWCCRCWNCCRPLASVTTGTMFARASKPNQVNGTIFQARAKL